jgi:hypothetical protein
MSCVVHSLTWYVQLPQPCRVPYAGTELQHHGRYDLLPFNPSAMEWVPASGGGIPYGRQPIEGGYEEDGSKLYHAAARIGNVVVPGKTGPHLVRTLLSGVSIWLSLVDMNDAREEQAWRLVTENT